MMFAPESTFPFLFRASRSGLGLQGWNAMKSAPTVLAGMLLISNPTPRDEIGPVVLTIHSGVVPTSLQCRWGLVPRHRDYDSLALSGASFSRALVVVKFHLIRAPEALRCRCHS